MRTSNYTDAQAQEIATYINFYNNIQTLGRTLKDLRETYSQAPSTEKVQKFDQLRLVADHLLSLTEGFRETVPQKIIDRINTPVLLIDLESLAKNTLLELN